MARIDTNGFEYNSTTANIQGGDIFNAAIGTTHARTGSRAMQLTGLVSTTPKGYLKKFLSATAAGPYWLRVAIYVVTTPSASNTIMNLNGASGTVGTTQRVGITLESNGTLILRNAAGTQIGSASSAINDSAFHVVELKIDGTPASGSRVAEARLDGTIFATSSTQTNGNPLAFSLGGNLAAEAQTQGEWWFDDLALNDSTGSFQTGYPGVSSVGIMLPSAAGDVNTFATQTGGTAGASNNFTRVNENPPDDATSFNGSSTLNQEDLFVVDASGIPTSATINAIQVGIRVRNNTADVTTAIKVEMEKTTGGTIAQGTAIVPNSTAFSTNGTSTPRNYTLTLYQDPDNVNWNPSTWNPQIGYKETVANVNRIDVTAVWAYVDYTPSAASPQTISPTAKASTLAFGTVGVTSKYTISATARASTLAIGTVSVTSKYTISETAISSHLAYGTPTLTPGAVSRSITGRASTLALGTVSITGRLTRSITAIGSTLAFGSPTVSGSTGGSQTISPSARASTLSFGSVTNQLLYHLSASGIASHLAFGTVTRSIRYTISPTGYARTTSFGTPQFSTRLTFSVSALTSHLSFGIPTSSHVIPYRLLPFKRTAFSRPTRSPRTYRSPRQNTFRRSSS